MAFSNIQRVPPGDGFVFVDPDTGHKSAATRYHNWLGLIREHREGNGLPPITPQEAEHQNCAGLAPEIRREFCKDLDNDSVQTIDLGLKDIVRGTMTVAAFKASGEEIVPPEEAERRADICANYNGFGCRYNVAYRSGCGVDCSELTDAVVAVVGGKTTSHDGRLKACAVCKCALKAKVWLPQDALQRFESAELQASYPDYCWLAKEQAPP